jgi:hypothetical protein
MTDLPFGFRHEEGGQILALFRFFLKDYLERCYFNAGEDMGKSIKLSKTAAWKYAVIFNNPVIHLIYRK